MPKKPASKKKTAVKKSAKKSSAKKKQAVKISAAKKKLITRLDSLIENLFDEDLEFLVSQAEILEYNRKVEERIAAGEENSDLKPEDFKLKKPDRSVADIIEGEGSNHFIIAGAGVRKFFDIQEMRKLVKLCHAAADREDATSRLYNWFDKNRRDYINDAEISGPGDLFLGAIYEKIIQTYAVKDER
jgi:hypothetical protein